MKKTLVITSAAALAALMMIMSAPAFAGVSLSIGLNLPIAPGVRIGASIGNHHGYGRGYRVLPPPPRVLLPAPVLYAAPVAYYPPAYAAPMIYSRPLLIPAPPRRVFRAAPPPRWVTPRPSSPIGYSAPGDKRRG